MAAASSSVPFFGMREEEQYNIQKQQPQQMLSATPSSSAAPAAAPPKKKRNLPGNPNPDAEVIALSPKALMATNRFICEVCNKGFQREQNLQLHRRGHNLPWKLKQKNPKEVRRRVYICPETTCVHHDPSRALGDLTGIKKHFCRKHGEKKWKCDKCSKRYAVQSDWKAHSKTCGTREYRCDCGTLFSRSKILDWSYRREQGIAMAIAGPPFHENVLCPRPDYSSPEIYSKYLQRDSFITHRAFCDALAQESARLPATMGGHFYGRSPAGLMNLGLPPVNSPHFSSLQGHQTTTPTSNDLLRLSGNNGADAMQFDHLPSFRPAAGGTFFLGGGSSQSVNEVVNSHLLQPKPFHGLMQLQDHHANMSSSSAAIDLFNLNIFSNNGNANGTTSNAAMNQFPGQFNNPAAGGSGNETTYAGNLMSHHLDANMYGNETALHPHMSATALLQKAAQMGATSSNSGGANSILRGFGNLAKNNPGAGFDGVGENSGGPPQAQNEAHFNELFMNSLGNGNGAINDQEAAAGFGVFSTGIGSNINDNKLQRNQLAMLGAAAAADKLTRDFLGVGGRMRSMGGGVPPRELHLGIDMATLDSELKSTRSFVGGGRMQ
ncbi:hypothetical protein ZIOFF_068092 [Zingiber officinale]|uniref:C2H2-type domain-containing protein n=1 Tax=Zingiber officinale TaxID=94328 RepID=A0A8J5EUW9_ZINOF|nr:hypothetical protein ZIOFF_068092 [Zingiber officinale]